MLNAKSDKGKYHLSSEGLLRAKISQTPQKVVALKEPLNKQSPENDEWTSYYVSCSGGRVVAQVQTAMKMERWVRTYLRKKGTTTTPSYVNLNTQIHYQRAILNNAIF